MLISLLAMVIVLGMAAFLVVLFVASVLAPSRAASFLGGFASSARTHYLEMALRLIVGGGFVAYAPFMAHALLFRVFGWILLVTTAALLLLPWRWHQHFAGWAVPFAIRNLRLYTGSGFLLAVFILYGVIAGNPPVAE